MPANPKSLHDSHTRPILTTYLLPNTLRLPPPIIRIRIKHKHVTIRECHVEHVSKEKENYNGRPLQPGGASGSHVMRRKCDEGEEEYEGDLDPVADGCDGHVFIVWVWW
mmetsp:Transcript_15618/g.29625  ORF Transcript_15618/g.29625 Transcript_15618/m.29625 type:complete len:109 (-) Transcript_15618:180-506(-)